MLRLAVDDLVAALRLPHAGDPFDGEPLVAVTLDRPLDDGLAGRLAGVPTIVAGVGTQPAAALDLVVPDDAALAPVAAAVDAHPHPALTLAVLLRGGPSRPVADGLAAESAAYATLQAGPDHRRWLDARAAVRGGSPPAPRQPGEPGRTPSDGEPVRVARRGDTVEITLAQPERRNAYSAAMRDGLVEALSLVAADPSLRAVLTGDGPAFCSGGDLDEFGTVPDAPSAHLLRLRRSAARLLDAVRDRVEVRVHGACVGAGVELPAFAGRVVADPGATFWLPEVAMGLVPGAGGTVSIPRRIGRQRTLWLALTGERIGAPQALAWGLVDAVA